MKDWKAWVGIIVSAFLLWWVFRGEDLGEIALQIRMADPALLILAGSINVTGGLVRALRWGLLLKPLGVPVSFGARWKALNIGLTVTNIAVGRLGEVARPYALSKMAPVSTSAALGTVALERVLDVVALLALLVVTLLAPDFPPGATILGEPVRYAVGGAVAMGAVLMSLTVALVVWPSQITQLVQRMVRHLPGSAGDKIVGALSSFLTGLRLLRDPASLVQAFLWSLVLWVWMAASFWAAFQAFGVELGFTAAMFTQCVVAVFVAIPAAPGFIGTLQAGVLVAVSGVFGIVEAEALSMSLGYHLAGFIPVTALGLYYAWGLRLRVSSLRAEVEAEDSSKEEVR